MPDFLLNPRVQTPIGEGVYQGKYRAVLSPVDRYLVRLPVNEQTSQHLNGEKCITPRAAVSALFVFDPGEVAA